MWKSNVRKSTSACKPKLNVTIVFKQFCIHTRIISEFPNKLARKLPVLIQQPPNTYSIPHPLIYLGRVVRKYEKRASVCYSKEKDFRFSIVHTMQFVAVVTGKLTCKRIFSKVHSYMRIYAFEKPQTVVWVSATRILHEFYQRETLWSQNIKITRIVGWEFYFESMGMKLIFL